MEKFRNKRHITDNSTETEPALSDQEIIEGSRTIKEELSGVFIKDIDDYLETPFDTSLGEHKKDKKDE